MAEPAPRSAARAELDAFHVLTDRFHAQLGAVPAQGATLAAFGGGDIESIAFTVMIDATRSAHDDLRAVMADIRTINDAKARLRRRLNRGKPRGKPVAGVIDAEAAVQLAATIAVSGIADEVRDLLRAQSDSLSEMSELDSLRLQMAMDRVSKMMSTLSNLLKVLADTQATIVQNLK